jgi:hypothetical protein
MSGKSFGTTQIGTLHATVREVCSRWEGFFPLPIGPFRHNYLRQLNNCDIELAYGITHEGVNPEVVMPRRSREPTVESEG